jgi:hypothetical protein
MSADPWEPIRPHMVRERSSLDPGMALLWERDDGAGCKTEVCVSPHDGGFVRAGHVGPRGGTTTVISGRPDKVRQLIREQRQVLYQVEKALEILEGE